MGLTSWKDAPDGKIQKFDVSVAKNYLNESEIAKVHAESEFEKYRIIQDRLFKSDFDRLLESTEED